MNAKLRPFVQLVKGLGIILGEDCEILLHDIERLEHSIVASANGHITGRSLGSPMSVYGLELLNSGLFSKENDVHMYMARANNGALIKCGVVALRDETGEIMGLLCVHFDTAKARAAREFFDQFLSDGLARKSEPINEFFGHDLDDVFKNALREAGAEIGKPVSSLSKKEKKAVIEKLIDRGFFMMKSAVGYVAREMGNSKFTIYGYIRELAKSALIEDVQSRK